MNRREILAASAALSAAAQTPSPPSFPQDRIDKADASVDSLLKRQILDKNHKYYGSYEGANGLYYGSGPTDLLSSFLNGYLLPQSRHFKKPLLAERMELAAKAFGRLQTKDGNWNLPFTNFNSPPDTAFIMQAICLDVLNARKHGFPEFEKWLLPAIEKAGDGLVRGGMHTPNHRWVASGALAGLHKLYGVPKYSARAGQWLAEGIDIDADGHYTERSTTVYNGVVNRALTYVAEWMNRPEYLDYVRRNLDASMYLLHADGEIVTEISRRQDANIRGTMYYHWFPLAYLAWKDRNRVYAHLARQLEPVYGSFTNLLWQPELTTALPEPQAPPSDFVKLFPSIGCGRIRRGPVSISVLRDKDRFFTFRRGTAVINAIRFSSAFFGKGQFVASSMTQRGTTFELTQELDAGYYQPFQPTRKISSEDFDSTRHERQRTEVCHMRYKATVTETTKGAKVRIEAAGTDEVPVTIEINLREGGTITGAEKLGSPKDAWLLKQGYASFTLGGETIKIGPGAAAHTYLDVRGARPRLEGPSLFLTGLTPFDHTIEIA
ncbi:MAG: hypothetical protein FJW32_01410 [Acidobacteria bacterium]|nr:hypothetical protein [Acidobacteriota bacterium]